jgi:O-methyltransferase involved in polyketide biosynthesis
VVCDLNNHSWFDKISFDPAEGIVFTAGGLFYYFEKEQVRSLLCAMAESFPGGMIAFDGVNALGLKGVSAEVKLAGNNSTRSFFSLERPKEELESWSPGIVNVVEKDYSDGYLKGGYRKTPVTRLFNYIMRTFHMSFMLHAEFAESL